MASAERAAQNIRGEGVRRELRQRAVEGQHESDVEPEGLQKLQLDRKRRQPEEGRFGSEELARMRFEDDSAGAEPFAAGNLFRRTENGLVPPMNAVEVSDGKDRTLEIGRVSRQERTMSIGGPSR
ncbi:MAG: hypothetical protein A49_24810 [Methyloceanibacter sp.]|nr:MAG: hypothetical protein A49_24810 [Methyloceanibacter sp.]